MEKDQIHGTTGTDSIVMKAQIVGVLDLVLAVAIVLPATILAQQELPNEVTWPKTLTSTQNPSPGHISHEADIVLPPLEQITVCGLEM